MLVWSENVKISKEMSMILGSLTYNSLLSLRILFFTRNIEELKMVDPSAVAIKENSRMQVDDMPSSYQVQNIIQR